MKSSTLQSVIALLAGASALGLAAPASAAVDNVRAAQANRQTAAPAASTDPDRMICVRTQLTGSRLMPAHLPDGGRMGARTARCPRRAELAARAAV